MKPTEIIKQINKLAKEHNYKRLPSALSKQMRAIYYNSIKELQLPPKGEPLYTLQGTLIATSYDRIVVGDYGAYIEFSAKHIPKHSLVVPADQKYRLRKPYIDTVKYLWFTTKDCSNCKIYGQLRGVTYADYKPGKFYISPYEIRTTPF